MKKGGNQASAHRVQPTVQNRLLRWRFHVGNKDPSVAAVVGPKKGRSSI